MTAWNRPRRWLRDLGSYAFTQLGVQALGFLAGLAVVRTLPPDQFAQVALAGNFQVTLGLLADTGIGIGLASIGGQIWRDRDRLGRLIATARSLRGQFALVALAAMVPLFVWLLVRNGSPAWHVFAITAAVILTLWAQLNYDALGAAPRLAGEVARVQRIDLAGNAVRLGAMLALAALGMLNAPLAVAVGSMVAVGQWLRLRPAVADLVDLDAKPDEANRSALLSLARSQVANTIFFCLQGQIGLWIIAGFGNTRGVADLGALGRLAFLLTIPNAIQNNLILPRFARLPADRPLLTRRYGQIVGIAAAAALGLWALSAIFPEPLLWLLGPSYAHLQRELPLLMASAALAYFAAVLWSLNFARAWVRWSWLNIPIALAIQAASVPLLDLATVRGVILFGLFPSLASIALNLWLSRRGLRTTTAP